MSRNNICNYFDENKDLTSAFVLPNPSELTNHVFACSGFSFYYKLDNFIKKYVDMIIIITLCLIFIVYHFTMCIPGFHAIFIFYFKYFR